MKKKFLLLLCLLVAAVTFAENKRADELKKLLKDAPTTDVFSYSTLGFGWKESAYSFTLLSDLKSSDLTEVETVLLKQFDKVAVCYKKGDIMYAYWVSTSKGEIGLVDFEGKVLVPLTAGIICNANRNAVVVGEKEAQNQSEWLGAWGNGVKKADGVGFGHFAAVVDDVFSEKINVLIPYGAYDDMMLTFKGAKNYYFVANANDEGELLWGMLNAKGEEEIPCENKGIYAEKKNKALKILTGVDMRKWETSKDKDMKDLANMVKNDEKLAEERRMAWAQSLATFGNALISTANTIDAVAAVKNGGEDGVSAGGGSYQSQYSNWERRAKQNYESLTNLGSKVKKNGKDVGGNSGQGASPANYTLQKKTLREAQKEMKRIREKASKEGINISKSEYEDVTVSY